jgi:hypothetical protein
MPTSFAQAIKKYEQRVDQRIMIVVYLDIPVG